MIEITRGVSDAQRIYDPDGAGKTLKGLGGGQGAKTGLYAVGKRVRRLTPLECERLMSWPDNWTQTGRYECTHSEQCLFSECGHVVEISDSQRYKMCGNGVVSTVVAAVIKAHLL